MMDIVHLALLLIILGAMCVAIVIRRRRSVDDPASRSELREVENQIHARITAEVESVSEKIEDTEKRLRVECGACAGEMRSSLTQIRTSVARIEERSTIQAHQIDDIGRKLDRLIERSRHLVTARVEE